MKKVKAKSNSKKVVAKKSSRARAVARPAAKGGAKYEQPGAPWWKRVPGPPPKTS